MEETKLTFVQGGEVKALGEVDGGLKVGGYLVRFSTQDDPDLTGDFFTKTTDFGDASAADGYFHHRMPIESSAGTAPAYKQRLGKATLRADDIGIWAELVLQARNDYEAFIGEMAKAGQLGWSSGTASHLVEREPAGKAMEIKAWPLGLDASLTPTPAEARNVIEAIKSINHPVEAEAEAAETAPEPAPVSEPTLSEPITEVKMDTEIETKFTELNDKIGKLTEIIEGAPALKKAPVVLKTGLGDTELKATAHFVRTGDRSGIAQLKASNNTDMNIGTAADGGDTVPTGHYAGIIARRDESLLRTKLGCRIIPGIGTDVIVPVDNEDDGEFVSTAEATTFDRDAPAISHQHFSLVKYTKKVQLSQELLQDTDANLMAFLDDFVGRGIAKTSNANLITAAGTGGTSNVTFAHNHTYTVGEFESLIYQHDTAYYLDDTASCAWITNPANYAVISALNGTVFQYVGTPKGNESNQLRPGLLGFPVYFSTKVTAIAASAKSLYFGNWNFMGYREGPGLTFLRDPYSSANTGQINLFYYFREVYGVLNSEAIAYGTHSTAAG